MYPDPTLLAKLDIAVRADLQAVRDSYFWWLLAMAVIVGVGVAMEGPEVIHETLQAVRSLRRRAEERPHTASPWMTFVALIGWILVVVGIAGEGVCEGLVSKADGLLQTFNDIILVASQRQAASAADSATAALTSTRESASLVHDARREFEQLRQEAEQLREGQAIRAFKDREAVGLRLRRFSRSLNFRKTLKVDLEFLESRGGCPDCEGTAKGIERVLRIYAGWYIAKEPQPHGDPNVEDFPEGVTVGVNFAEGDTPEIIKWLSDAADALVKELNCTQISAIKLTIPAEASPEDIIQVRVGPKPIPKLGRPSKPAEPCRNLDQ